MVTQAASRARSTRAPDMTAIHTTEIRHAVVIARVSVDARAQASVCLHRR